MLFPIVRPAFCYLHAMNKRCLPPPSCKSQRYKGSLVAQAFAVVNVGLVSSILLKYGPNFYISPKHLRILEERHLFNMLASCFGE